jgi:hypothetical protein
MLTSVMLESRHRARHPDGTLALAAVGVLLVTAIGCASHQKYPPSWPTLLNQPSGCTQLDGVYKDRGTSAYWSSSLAHLLFARLDIRRVVTVTLSLSATGQLQADARDESGDVVVAAVLAAGKPLVCRNGMVIVPAGAQWFGGPHELGFTIGQKSASFELHAAKDFLVVKKKTRTWAVWVAIPWTYVEDEWHRFERVVPQASRAQDHSSPCPSRAPCPSQAPVDSIE